LSDYSPEHKIIFALASWYQLPLCSANNYKAFLLFVTLAYQLRKALRRRAGNTFYLIPFNDA
jgi:hypothetical protein